MDAQTAADIRVCEHCGDAFVRPAGTRPGRRFCSRDCGFAARRADPIARFWARVDRSGGRAACWPWLGAKTRGRGRWKVDGRQVYAYRYAYEVLAGPIPDGLVLDHLCRNPQCCNPRHLEPVTSSENTRRGVLGVPRPQQVREAISAGHLTSERSKAAVAARRGVTRDPSIGRKISATKRAAYGTMP